MDELAREKLPPLLRLRYHGSIANAQLGRPGVSDLQKYIYAEAS